MGVHSADQQYPYYDITFSEHTIRANAAANLKKTHVSRAYGKDFICRFQDNMQKRKQQILENDLSGHQSDAMV